MLISPAAARMYGDCQVLSSMGVGNIVSSDHLFSSPIRSPPNLNFMANMQFHHSDMGLVKGKEEEIESRSGSGGQTEGVSADEQENEQLPKKKRYHRHTARQIQEMEALFKECPHPDDKQRLKLSQELGLKPRQVKFWFQNRRTQMKAQQDRADNVMLRAENESLKTENFRLQAAIRNLICPGCGGPAMLGEMSFDEQHLRLENARLKEELDRLSCMAARYSASRPLSSLMSTHAPAPHMLLPSLDLDMNMYSKNFHEPTNMSTACTDHIIPANNNPGCSVSAADHNYNHHHLCEGLLEHEKPLALNLAMAAVDELLRMCRADHEAALWVRSNTTTGGNKEVLDVEEYKRLFHWPMNLKQQVELKTEASRDCAVVITNSINLVDVFLDANKWVEMFPSIISRAKTIQIITPGVSGHGNGCLQLMHAELQVLSPLVPTREATFLRYCHQNVEADTISWVIVDFPVDGFHEGIQGSSFPRYRRRPSGCIIQDVPNGYSRVTWLEHAEVEDKPAHQVFDHFLSSGMAFGAQRWLAVLQRQCERLACLTARNISDHGVIPSPEVRGNMMKLAQRMMRTFCVNISSCDGQSWTAVSDSASETLRITTRKNIEPGQPHGVILTAVSTTWLPYPPSQVFDLLRDERRRSQLDVLSNGNALHEVAHIANGSHPGNCTSLLRVNAATNSSQNVELMLQESCSDPSGSLVVYATVDVDAVQVAMSGEDPSYIPLLPHGFVILPAGGQNNIDQSNSASDQEGSGSNGSSSAGCLLTAGFQVLASAVPSAKVNLSSVNAMNNHVCNAVRQISAALSGGSGNGGGASELGRELGH